VPTAALEARGRTYAEAIAQFSADTTSGFQSFSNRNAAEFWHSFATAGIARQ
jgi:hypothetical protein